MTKNINRRDFIKKSAWSVAGLTILPSFLKYTDAIDAPLMTRRLGKTEREVTTFGLGGQASIQWSPDDVDPVAIILKAFDKGVNYFDTSNLYGPSQMNYGKAFNHLGLIPGKTGYNEKLRKSTFLTSKTHLRYAKGDISKIKGLNNWSDGGDSCIHTVDDLKRTMTQVFGDGKGNYPKGAYLDMILLHDVSLQIDVDSVFEGLDNTDPKAEYIGALAALRDYRDGTNLTGLNPKEEKLIKHIGFSGHYNAVKMMEIIRRDTHSLFDGMLVAINANDKLNLNMQHNVIPVASAKDIGIIGMKTFADGAMYTKEATWSNKVNHVVRQVGSPQVSYEDLIQYSLTTPGIDTLIVGIGQISDQDAKCQLSRNIKAAQIERDGLTKEERLAIEKMANKVKDGKTNYFQDPEGGLTAAQNITATKSGNNKITLKWDTAYAGSEAIVAYEISKNGKLTDKVSHSPQTTLKQFESSIEVSPTEKTSFVVTTIDEGGNKKSSDIILI